MTRIYTRTGDQGETGLVGGKRVPKDSARVEAYGAVDELSALLGLAQAFSSGSRIESLLTELQKDLFLVGSALATPQEVDVRSGLHPERVRALEEAIDWFQGQLPQLNHFILPGGTRGAALLHMARSVARRAERRVVALTRDEDVTSAVLSYLNRLSDLLFVMARWENRCAGVAEEQWVPVGNGRGE